VTAVVDARAVLGDLRATRRRHRVEDLDWFEALYRAYLAALVGIAVTLFASSAVGDKAASATGIADAIAHGPAVVGLVIAVGVAVGLRSGSRGGPFALENAEVRHVLLAPVERRQALFGPATHLLRFALFVGAVVGAVAGQLASKRLPHGSLRWIASGAATGTVAAAAAVGVALVAGGQRLNRTVATLASSALLVWAVLDVLDHVWSPFRVAGHLALWPLDARPIDLLSVVVTVACVAAGVAGLGGYRLEDAERRTGLVGQIRFAATMQDLRTVIVLRRQLALEQLRVRPLLSRRPTHPSPQLPTARSAATPAVTRRRRPWSAWTMVARRDGRGLRRFPLVRTGRMLAMAAIAGLALRGVWHGTTPFALVAAAALMVAAYDATEPLAQEGDHPDRSDLVPVERGVLLVRHLPSVAVTMVLLGLAAMGVAVAVERTRGALALGLITVVPASLAAASGAVVSVTLPPPEPFKDGQLLPPEVAGMKIMVRAAWPFVMALLGTAPVVSAVAAARAHPPADPLAFAGLAAVFCMLPPALTVAWVRFREPARAWWSTFLQQGQHEAAQRAQAKATTPTRTSR